jgi:glycosyltransferase involved in cell wall biosynthesis
MKIAMIQTPLILRGGAERQILRLAIELQKLGHEVEIFTYGVDEEKCYPNLLKKVKINVVSHPLSLFRTPYRSSTKETISTSWAMRLLTRALREYTEDFPIMLNIGRKIPKGFDIINNHNFPTNWAAFFAKKRLKIPVVWMCNEPPLWLLYSETKNAHVRGRRKRWPIVWPLCGVFDKITVKYVDEIVVLSDKAEGLVKRTYNRLPKIIRSGVDVKFFHGVSGREAREKYNLEKDFVLLQVGSLISHKRQIDSIKTIFYLSEKYDNVKLILDGVGRDFTTLKHVTKKLGVEDKVIFTSISDDRELTKLYAACDVFVFPSEITWGLAVIEAMAATRAVIVSNKAGASEIIENNVNGIVVDHAKPQKIAEQVEILMNNPKLRKKLGENAYEYVLKNLSWEKCAENMESVFQETISNFRRSS